MITLSRRTVLSYAAFIPLNRAVCSAQATPFPAAGFAQAEAPVSMLIQNNGSSPDQLIAARSAVSRRIMLHATRLELGERVMREVSAMVVPPDSGISLEPGAMHLMLVGLTRSLVQGQVFPLRLTFADAGEVLIDVRVRRKQDAAGVAEIPPAVAGPLTILHASAPPTSAVHR